MHAVVRIGLGEQLGRGLDVEIQVTAQEGVGQRGEEARLRGDPGADPGAHEERVDGDDRGEGQAQQQPVRVPGQRRARPRGRIGGAQGAPA
jgi:hypothetical protein